MACAVEVVGPSTTPSNTPGMKRRKSGRWVDEMAGGRGSGHATAAYPAKNIERFLVIFARYTSDRDLHKYEGELVNTYVPTQPSCSLVPRYRSEQVAVHTGSQSYSFNERMKGPLNKLQTTT